MYTIKEYHVISEFQLQGAILRSLKPWTQLPSSSESTICINLYCRVQFWHVISVEAACSLKLYSIRPIFFSPSAMWYSFASIWIFHWHSTHNRFTRLWRLLELTWWLPLHTSLIYQLSLLMRKITRKGEFFFSSVRYLLETFCKLRIIFILIYILVTTTRAARDP